MILEKSRWEIVILKQNMKTIMLQVHNSFHLILNYLAVNKNHFQFHYVIGRGGFGKVWKIEKKRDKKMFAMKEMHKGRVIQKRSVNSVMNEKKFLT